MNRCYSPQAAKAAEAEHQRWAYIELPCCLGFGSSACPSLWKCRATSVLPGEATLQGAAKSSGQPVRPGNDALSACGLFAQEEQLQELGQKSTSKIGMLQLVLVIETCLTSVSCQGWIWRLRHARMWKQSWSCETRPPVLIHR